MHTQSLQLGEILIIGEVRIRLLAIHGDKVDLEIYAPGETTIRFTLDTDDNGSIDLVPPH